ncbi:hypothetical protein BaRGS_00040240 [Batillaria attramentaria]|uniref:Uncharacterized protein n=1 Tax=Batillaria attramentaria TaxID=370345 RepID=A0ABD0J0Z6_9CAEN
MYSGLCFVRLTELSHVTSCVTGTGHSGFSKAKGRCLRPDDLTSGVTEITQFWRVQLDKDVSGCSLATRNGLDFLLGIAGIKL